MTEFKAIDYLAEIIMYILYRYILFCSWESCAVYSYLLWFMQLHIIKGDHFSVHFWKSTVQSNLRLFAGLTKPFRNHVLYPVRDSEWFRTWFSMQYCIQNVALYWLRLFERLAELLLCSLFLDIWKNIFSPCLKIFTLFYVKSLQWILSKIKGNSQMHSAVV